jgi:methylated-DNA-[protein]-cysteine S-methyltransferase
MPGALIPRHSIPVDIVAYEAPGWGIGELWLDGGRVVNHELPVPGRGLRQRAARAARQRAGDGLPLRDRIVAYFRGERDDFGDVALELEWCTPFQRAVVDALRAVPYGETVTYGELAALAGYPNAQRAAGSVCAGNRFPIVVPCHRVVAASGLGRFGSLGSGYKRRILALEGIGGGRGEAQLARDVGWS